MTGPRTKRRRPALKPSRCVAVYSGITLIELIVFIFWISCAVFGAGTGLDYTREMSAGWQILGLLAGGVLGAVGGIAAIMGLLTLFTIPSIVRRALEPADLPCRCNEPGAVVAPHLSPSTPLDMEAVAASRHWAVSPDFTSLHWNHPPAEDKLRSQLATGRLTLEQVSLAACLGEPAAAAIATPPAKPLVRYRHWGRLPPDLQLVLHSGLPPRLCMVWSMSSAARALAAFEREFHQDTRPRQKFGLAVMALSDDSPPETRDVLIAWKRAGTHSASAPDHGCRVLHRTLWQRMRGGHSRGQHARTAVIDFASNVAEFFSPDRLWYTYPPGDVANAYETPHNRAVWCLPSFGAQEVAHAASLAADSKEEEFALQRTELARMILSWPRWSEDRDEWAARVDSEFIPKIEQIASALPFNVPKYIALIRELHIPNTTASPLQRAGESPTAPR